MFVLSIIIQMLFTLKNDEVLLDRPFCDDVIHTPENRKLLNVRDIVSFADEVEIKAVWDILKRQIVYNTAISNAGMHENYGAGIGEILIRSYGNSVQNRAKALCCCRFGCKNEWL